MERPLPLLAAVVRARKALSKPARERIDAVEAERIRGEQFDASRREAEIEAERRAALLRPCGCRRERAMAPKTGKGVRKRERRPLGFRQVRVASHATRCTRPSDEAKYLAAPPKSADPG